MSKSSLLAALAAGAHSGSQYFGMVSQEAFLSKKREETAQYESTIRQGDADHAAGLAEEGRQSQAAINTKAATIANQRQVDAANSANDFQIILQGNGFTEAQRAQAQSGLDAVNMQRNQIEATATNLDTSIGAAAASQEDAQKATATNLDTSIDAAATSQQVGIDAAAASQQVGIDANTDAATARVEADRQTAETLAKTLGDAAMQRNQWDVEGAAIGRDHATTMQANAHGYNLAMTEVNKLNTEERDAALAAVTKEQSIHLSSLNKDQLQFQYDHDAEIFEKNKQLAAQELKGASPAIIAEDLRIQEANRGALQGIDGLLLMEQMLLAQVKGDGIISNQGRALMNKLGIDYNEGQSVQAVWDMLRAGLAIDKLSSFTGSTTDYEYEKVLLMFPSSEQANTTSLAQVRVSLTLAVGVYNSNVDQLALNRKSQGGFNAMTPKARTGIDYKPRAMGEAEATPSVDKPKTPFPGSGTTAPVPEDSLDLAPNPALKYIGGGS